MTSTRLERIQPNKDFYSDRQHSEAERLQAMAMIADPVSLEQLRRILNGNRMHSTVVDIGSGNSTSLGKLLVEDGVTYLPLDIEKKAVESQRTAGFEARQSTATDLPLADEAADALHSRFTWGWLSPHERQKSLAEMIRVAKEQSGIVVIDYDWSAVTGPKEFTDIIDQVKAVMKMGGFDPEYGQTLADDMHAMTQPYISGVDISVTRHDVYVGALVNAMEFASLTARAIIDQLRAIGDYDGANTISESLAQLNRFVENNPEVEVRLPQIVSASFVIHEKSTQVTDALRSMHAQKESSDHEPNIDGYEEENDYVVFGDNLDLMGSTVLARSPRLIRDARRVQAEAYLKDGIIADSGISADGTLSLEIDPDELVSRSSYVVTIGDGVVKGAVRLIEGSPEDGVDSLPTISRIKSSSPDAYAYVRNHAMSADGKKVLEVSALSKNPLHGDFMDVIKSVLALAYVAREQGYDYGVMGLQQGRVNLIKKVFGEKSFEYITANDAIHPVQLPGVKDSMMFTPLIVDVKAFLDSVHANAVDKCQHGPNAIFETIMTAINELEGR